MMSRIGLYTSETVVDLFNPTCMMDTKVKSHDIGLDWNHRSILGRQFEDFQQHHIRVQV